MSCLSIVVIINIINRYFIENYDFFSCCSNLRYIFFDNNKRDHICFELIHTRKNYKIVFVN